VKSRFSADPEELEKLHTGQAQNNDLRGSLTAVDLVDPGNNCVVLSSRVQAARI
jgi:hypothetical protein